MSKKEPAERAPEEAELIMNAALTRALNMPPKPHERKEAAKAKQPSKPAERAKRARSRSGNPK